MLIEPKMLGGSKLNLGVYVKWEVSSVKKKARAKRQLRHKYTLGLSS